MYVIKRDGRKEAVKFDKITARIKKLCYGLDPIVTPEKVAMKVIEGLYDGVTTSELDDLAAEVAALNVMTHPDYGLLASRIAISNLHENTKASFSETIEILHKYIDPKSKEKAPLISETIYKIIKNNADKIDSEINYERDFKYGYFGFKTLEKSYLLRLNNRVIERPQHMLMRVALEIHKKDIKSVLETYNYMSEGWFLHASPTLFSSSTPNPQMSSCFSLDVKEDSISGIYDTLSQCAKISQSAGGVGLSVHNIRAKGSYIKGTNGTSNGIVPMLKVFNDTAKYVDQGGAKRKGSFAIYIEPWHADIFDFLDLKKNQGKEELRARDLFYSLWIPDLFMKRVEENSYWTLMCPHECPGLSNNYGKKFDLLYTKYEEEGRGKKTIKAQDLWSKILESQIETGNPYMLYKDSANRKSNQKNLGTIKSSNLCTEIIQYTSADEVAVCNLASISLPKFVQNKNFDFEKLFNISYKVAINLDKLIDANYYPINEAKHSNLQHRPIGIGIQGLADAFALLNYPFESLEARKLNKEIFETIYYAALTASKDLAIISGPYKTWKGSPISKGIFQFDMWNVKPSDRWEWNLLKEEIKKYGVRNSLLVAPMPTSSTSKILGNHKCFEPFNSNIYKKKVLDEEFIIVNKYLLKELVRLGIWDDRLRKKLIASNGSIQSIDEIPKKIKSIYKTAWEIPPKILLEMAAERGAFIDQSQSLNIFMENANFSKLSSVHFYGWKAGLKTGMYNLKTKSSSKPFNLNFDKFIDFEPVAKTKKKG